MKNITHYDYYNLQHRLIVNIRTEITAKKKKNIKDNSLMMKSRNNLYS